MLSAQFPHRENGGVVEQVDELPKHVGAERARALNPEPYVNPCTGRLDHTLAQLLVASGVSLEGPQPPN